MPCSARSSTQQGGEGTHSADRRLFFLHSLVRGYGVGGCSLFLFLFPHRTPSQLPMSVPRCPNGMVEAEPCTPWSDLKCDKQESGTQAIGEAPIPGESVTSPGPPTTPSPSSGSSELVLRIVPGTVCAVLLLLLSACACYHWRRICQGEVGCLPHFRLFLKQKHFPLLLPNSLGLST